MKPRLLLTGASGYLGRHLARHAVNDFELTSAYGRRQDRVAAGTPLPLDVTEREAVHRAVETQRPQVIVHCAAANPGRPEAEMVAVNVAGSRHVAEAAAEAGARLIHLSTDVIFDGLHPPYAETAPPTPVNPYGHSKAAAESMVAEIAPGAAIVRTSLIYGLDEIDRSNAGFIERLQKGRTLALWMDVIRQPIWVETLANALLELASTRLEVNGPLNVTGGQALSRWDFGRRMLAYWGVTRPELERVQAGLAADEPFPVALDLRLDLSRARSLLTTPLLGVDEVLAQKR